MGLEVIDLTTEFYHYETSTFVKLLDQVSVQIEPKKITAIIGEIGSGKSTFIKHLNGLHRGKTGTILVQNRELTNMQREWLQKVGIVLQFSQNQLFLRTVEEELMYAMNNFGLETNVAAICELIQLDEALLSAHPKQLSGGQMRKVAIGSVLAAQPEILILDEPFAGLDWQAQAEMTALFERLKAQGMTVVVVTHDLTFVYEKCDEVIVFAKGKIVAKETPQQLLSDEVRCQQFGITRAPLLQLDAFMRLERAAIRTWLEKGAEDDAKN